MVSAVSDLNNEQVKEKVLAAVEGAARRHVEVDGKVCCGMRWGGVSTRRGTPPRAGRLAQTDQSGFACIRLVVTLRSYTL